MNDSLKILILMILNIGKIEIKKLYSYSPFILQFEPITINRSYLGYLSEILANVSILQNFWAIPWKHEFELMFSEDSSKILEHRNIGSKGSLKIIKCKWPWNNYDGFTPAMKILWSKRSRYSFSGPKI